MEQPAIIRYEQIIEESVHTRDYVLAPEVYENFLRAFEDQSPIHVDAAYAREAGFAGPVMHGTILNGFVSHFVGMVFPGSYSLLLSVDMRYAQPSYLGDVLRLTAKVVQKMDVHQVVVLHVTFHNQTQGCLAANGRVQVKVRNT
jgi:acyl dehydratase